MKVFKRVLPTSLLCLGLGLSLPAMAVDISGNTGFEINIYEDEGQFESQDYRSNLSFAAQPEFYWEWHNGDNSLIFTPFFRLDEQDEERTHGDIRELAWTYVNNQWEIHTGIRKVFWGVTEFVHLVDVINQTDNVESADGEEKLGQAMVQLSRATNWGIFDGFILLGFRERTFAGEDGRLRPQLLVDTDQASYESGDEDKHIDFALRWSHSVDIFDVGVSIFEGTDREPILQVGLSNGEVVLTPFYQQVTQIGIDLQATIDNWLWKLELIHKDSDQDTFAASQAGFEYTFYGVAGSTTDIGALLEYGWDERGEDASSLSQNDIYLGTRITLNDANDSTLLMGFSYDVDYYSRSFIVEASKRLNDRWTIALEGLFVDASNSQDPSASLDQDDRIQLTFERFF
ncbi:MAG: hypothetical protein AAFZ92_07345 [Pseudomonadota bacterium]